METGKSHRQGLPCFWFWRIMEQLCLQSLLELVIAMCRRCRYALWYAAGVDVESALDKMANKL